MAYRRKTRRGPRRKRRTNRRLSKHMVRAIKAISQQPVETKSYPESADFGAWLTSASYAGGPQASIRSNIFSEIPNIKNTLQKTEESFIGNQIMSRGLRWEIHLYTEQAAALAPDVQFRFTVYKDTKYFSGIDGPGSSDRIFDQSMNTTATWAVWNHQATKILFRRTFKLAQFTQTTGMLQRKYYVPLRRKITRMEEEGTLSNSFMRELKDANYYWVLEMLAPTISNLTSISGTIGSRIYFKDA
nr:MAG TPA: Capsid protein [Cressdnaviricota sp.]